MLQPVEAPPRLRLQRVGLMPYQEAWDLQGRLVEARQAGRIPDTLLLLQHPHTYTFGRRAAAEHLLLDPQALRERDIATHWVDRGGDVTYHGPGQVVGYPIIDLRSCGLDVHRYLRALEQGLISTLAAFGIAAGRDPDYTGVWVPEGKIAAIGVKISRGVTSHGFALNVNTDLSFFEGIVPCGIAGRGVTSMAEVLGKPVDIAAVEEVIEAAFPPLIGPKGS
jgi:lipoate-protein ligase B